MSTVPIKYASLYPAGLPAAVSVRQSLSWTGIAAFTVALLVFFSAFEKYRIPIGGLLVHAYLLPLVPLGLFVLLYRIGEFPRGALVALTIFTALFCFSTLQGPSAAQESAKMIAGTVTIIVMALMVRSDKDFRLASLGLMFAVTALAFLGLVWKTESFAGANPLDVSNENAFSLYTLPPLLIASSLLFERKGGKYWFVLLPCILVVVVATFSSANRSGWLGVALILLMQLFRPRTVRIIPLVVILGALSYWAVDSFGDKALLKTRYEETVSGKTSDDLRIKLFVGCLQIGLDYPILGISPQQVGWELPERIDYKTFVDSHNVYGYIIAGCGFIVFAIFLAVGWLLWRRPPSEHKGGLSRLLIFSGSPHFRLLRMMLVLWMVRGVFSREILYSPGFCIGLGLTIGLCISQGMWKQRAQAQRAPVQLGRPVLGAS